MASRVVYTYKPNFNKADYSNAVQYKQGNDWEIKVEKLFYQDGTLNEKRITYPDHAKPFSFFYTGNTPLKIADEIIKKTKDGKTVWKEKHYFDAQHIESSLVYLNADDRVTALFSYEIFTE